ncbi:3-hydroxyacyl-CoA dehydrogenase family protein [Zhouia spongiae]|uniref:3-hydroxyacyl-CoA dehydrogenase family protein n=1 Tax=Zhouia spongiae TaxID=2202721 RepID=A0ABY3YKN5_9FLAO|nr:3-hydroxyacyl-CoA dehydrogenase family protein [Zhouia spongiae]UNY98315.1 3-hydroxyacyl-CoA dehydrogenase family protein [Zhouia spongiae]
MENKNRFKVVGVIGAGTIGIGVAQNLAQKNISVVLLDITEVKLKEAKARIQQNVRLYSIYSKEKNKIDVNEVLNFIKFTTNYQELENVDYIIENVTENWEIKKQVYSKINSICTESTVFAANTSCISITKIAHIVDNPERVIGVHFMNPVPLKDSVEVIKGVLTNDKTISVTNDLLSKMKKDSIVINDMPGFVSNRLMTFMINEAAFLVQENVASASDIDNILKNSYAQTMGPLETADLIGIDTILHSMEVLYDSFKDGKYRPCPLLYKMTQAGMLGRKSGQGFYKYNTNF